MRIPAFALAAFVILSVNSAAQDGFDAASVRSFLEKRTIHVPKAEPASAEDDQRMLTLGVAIVEFRSKAVTKSNIGDAENIALDVFRESKVSRKFPYIWPYIVAGSFYVGGNSLSDEPIAALYNPYYDVVILTRWKLSPGGTRFDLTEAVPVCGRAFMENRSTQPEELPIWTDSKAVFEVKFVEAAQNFVREFEKRYPPFGRNPAPRLNRTAGTKNAVATIERRVMHSLKLVRDAVDPKAPVNYASEISKVKNALSSPFSSKLERLLPEINPQNAQHFFQLGPKIRAGMEPYLVIERTVILIDPENLPLGFISLHLDPEDKSEPVEILALFNLEGRYPVN